MKNILIVTKESKVDLELLTRHHNYTLVHFSGDFNKACSIDFPKELNREDYDEIWILDLYGSKIYRVLASLLRYITEKKLIVKPVVVFSNSTIDVSQFHKFSAATKLSVVIWPIAISDQNKMVVSDQQSYLEYFISTLLS